ncbi:4-oxalomesaconate tautomerase [Phaeobacter sp. QD34_3]|jgi:4-oxalomesaconate tautomerase|uniref:4-oxalomesaconate tautomerase n=1 Tax=unclassified Phaeobacter TaxID=2621772 RepID=UPI00237F7D32|nr:MULTISPECIES: 4-oxalomesaconate tautomerase [unclassified Phaeobacter]MDE4133506.1 4-oxalomesaconate tautomerase [Phaeobacter sp. QD34_3]MDE4137142.1 4-oxalomesaconate tautomerase [Phaeobacter sp. QD34_24]
MSDGLRAMWMRGGTSKGLYLLAEDLPGGSCPAPSSALSARDALLLGVMGSPDPRQIDGIGGADPLTSKVAVVRRSVRPGVDVDYLFLQVFVDRALVSDAQNCGNILAGVGPFAIERGLVAAQDGETPVTIYMENTGQIAVARVATPGRQVTYEGRTRIDGAPGTAAAIPIEFRDTAGSACGALLPTGNVTDQLDGITVTMIDNGMPCVLLHADALGLSGQETPAELEANAALRARLETIRLAAGPRMNLGDVSQKSVPKMCLLSPATAGGTVMTRTFIPHRCHSSIGVLGAVSVATACLVPGAVGHDLAHIPEGSAKSLSIEHPTGQMAVIGHIKDGTVARAEIIRTARKLMDGTVFPGPTRAMEN